MTTMPRRKKSVHTKLRSVAGIAAAGVALWGTLIATDNATIPLSAGAAPNQPIAQANVLADQPSTPGTVLRAVDGDTVHVRTVDNPDVTVRILGIDTPETVKPGTPVACGGVAASDHAKRVLAPGADVVLVGDPRIEPVDFYGRRLAYVFVGRANYSLDAVRDGFGRFAEYGKRISLHDAYAQAEQDAQSARAGLWGSCAPDAAYPPR